MSNFCTPTVREGKKINENFSLKLFRHKSPFLLLEGGRGGEMGCGKGEGKIFVWIYLFPRTCVDQLNMN